MMETHLLKRRQTVKLGLIKVIKELFPEETLKTAYSIQEGVFCKLAGSALSVREVEQINQRLQAWVKSDEPIEYLCRKDGYYQYEVGNMIIKVLYPGNDRAGKSDPFRILPYRGGFIVDFGDAQRAEYTPLIPPDTLSLTYEHTQKWLKNINMEIVDDVNAYVTLGDSIELISIAEALQEKEIGDIADLILQQKRSLRVLLISGPSSSGKTSFAQRISTQLRVNGLRPVPLSLDDYFVDRDKTPLDEDGRYDFENLGALDLPLLQEHVQRLVRGEKIESPLFDFTSGNRMKKTKSLKVGPSEILVIEGIHALNPKLLPDINRSNFFKIYISALFELNVDFMNRVPTTEVRLIRRLVRGDRFRSTSPEETLNQWPSVRRGEYNNVFKYQEEADIMFNSSLLYEMNLLRPFAEISLNKIKKDSVHYETKERLLNLLSFFEPIELDKVPYNSILREFIGGSIYFK